VVNEQKVSKARRELEMVVQRTLVILWTLIFLCPRRNQAQLLVLSMARVASQTKEKASVKKKKKKASVQA